MGVALRLAGAARAVCPDADKERMWAIAMGLTEDEKALMTVICLTYIDGEQAAKTSLRENH